MAVQIKKSNALGMLNMTPLIDVVFQLLIFFLVATRFAQEDRELDVTLPSASAAQPLIAEARELFVNIDRNGRYFVDGRIRPAAELEQILRQAVADNPANQTVFVRADKDVKWDAVAQVFDLCVKTGVAHCVPAAEGE